eukprot:COSAG01_NODE_11684_length_1879_cov_236.520787_1_plen_71_part_10
MANTWVGTDLGESKSWVTCDGCATYQQHAAAAAADDDDDDDDDDEWWRMYVFRVRNSSCKHLLVGVVIAPP